MDQETLSRKYQAALAENEALRNEIKALKARLSLTADSMPQTGAESVNQKAPLSPAPEMTNNKTRLNREMSPLEKLSLFMSLFSGRTDAYARRWESRQGKAGYSPVCRNEWKAGACRKPTVKCGQCKHRQYNELTTQVIEDHLRGRITVGIYPLFPDETCLFLAIDCDKDGWQTDLLAIRRICAELEIPAAFERSRSGNGGHVWFFFDAPIGAARARKFGSTLITCAMDRNSAIPFRSYDRLFPNQDTLPAGGLGNLIALPLQKKSRDQGNSVFIDENFEPYPDQWEYLSAIQKMSEEMLISLTALLGGSDELGDLRAVEEPDEEKPWTPKRKAKLTPQDFPSAMTIVRSNMIFIAKAGITHKGRNALKRLAAFRNPQFYKAQAMRLSTYGKERVISCSDETDEYLCLPRGCEPDILSLLSCTGVALTWLDKRQPGKAIRVDFNGLLRDNQEEASVALLAHDTGVLAATTAFGKTVVAAKIIAERKVNTLILVSRQQLLG